MGSGLEPTAKTDKAMCEFCGCGTGRPMKRSAVQRRTTKAPITIRAAESVEPITKAAAGGRGDRRAGSMTGGSAVTQVGLREVSERRAAADI